MIKLKIHSIFIYLIISFFTIEGYSQIEKTKSETWIAFKNSAHNIGFCVYHIQQEACEDHSEVKDELLKISDPESEVYYYQLDSKWAKNRLISLAKNNASKPENYFILFDVDQGSFAKLYDSTKTSNSYKMFSVFDLRDNFEIKTHRKSNSSIIFKIVSDRASSILTNTMWREFFSHRLGRLSSEIEISLIGSTSLKDYHSFKDKFMNFVKK